MPNFQYSARTSSGDQNSGTIEAATQAEALRSLQREGKVVIDIRIAGAAADDEMIRLRHAASGIKREEVISMASQLGVMIDTGVPLAEALDVFVAQSRSGSLRRVMDNVADRITGGQSFSDAIRDFPKTFPPLMTSLLKASEATGKLGMMLGRIADYLSKERKILKQIKGALTYPMVMVSLALTVTGFLVAFVLPRFAKIYAGKKAALPPITKFVMGVSDFVTAHWLVIVCLAGAAAGGVISLWFFPKGRRFIDTTKVRAPLIGKMFGQFYLARAARTLSTLLGAGVPLLEAVRIVRGVTGNLLWQDLWDQVERSMTSGSTLSEVILKSPLIPPANAHMIAAGERTAKLPDVLGRIADAVEEELDGTIRSVTQLIEPAMIVFMGVVIGGIAIALLLPIFSVAQVMSGKK